jgi:hypothetical protein
MDVLVDISELEVLTDVQATVLARRIKLEIAIPTRDNLVIECGMPFTAYHKVVDGAVTAKNVQEILKYIGTYVMTVDGYTTTDGSVCYITTNETGEMITTRYTSLIWLMSALSKILIRTEDPNLEPLGVKLLEMSKRLELLRSKQYDNVTDILRMPPERRFDALKIHFITLLNSITATASGVLSLLSNLARLSDSDIVKQLHIVSVNITDEVVNNFVTLNPIQSDKIEIYKMYVTLAELVVSELVSNE